MQKFIKNELSASDIQSEIKHSFSFSDNDFITEIKYSEISLNTKVVFSIYYKDVIIFRILNIMRKSDIKYFITKNIRALSYYKKLSADILDSIKYIILTFMPFPEKNDKNLFYYQNIYYIEKNKQHLIKYKTNAISSRKNYCINLFENNGKLSLNFSFNKHIEKDLKYFCHYFEFNKIKNIPFAGMFDSVCNNHHYKITIKNSITTINVHIIKSDINKINIDILRMHNNSARRIIKEIKTDASLNFIFLEQIIGDYLIKYFINNEYLNTLNMHSPLSKENIEYIKLINY